MNNGTSPTTSGVELDDVDVDTIEDKYMKYKDMKECPFPPADTIDPCKCFADERYRLFFSQTTTLLCRNGLL